MRLWRCQAGAPRPIWTARTMIAAAQAAGCDAIHPGYGFLAERADFRATLRRGRTDLRRPDAGASGVVRRQGARPRRRGAACRCAGDPRPRPRGYAGGGAGVLRLAGTGGAMIIKAVAGGGGRGTRAVLTAGEDRTGLSTLPVRGRGRRSAAAMSTSRSSSRAPAMSRCRSSATAPATSRIWASANAASSAAFRRSSRSPPRPLWMTACAREIIDAAVRFASSVGYSNLGTFEFLVDVSGRPVRRRSCSSRRTRGCRWSTR